MSLSLCMIVKNEEDNLKRCLDSVKDIVDEMIIVDTGSTDSTVEIAEIYGARVYHFPWNDNFSDARNYSLQFATCDWILIMDADDELVKEDQQIVLDIVGKNEADACFFQTICYIGDEPGFDTVSNMNVRLIKNHMGYFFSNPIHEQIYSNIFAINPSAKILNVPVKIYHYGYINRNIIQHDKRKRNIRILEKELEQNPGYGFALFNLGNEYFALGSYEKAMEYYESAYSKFDPHQGFSSKLVFKMINCLVHLGRYDEAFKHIDKGLTFYPDFTDLVHMKALCYYWLHRYSLAIKYLNKCLRMGDAPFYLNIIVGAGSYRSYLFLGEIHYDLEDYDSAIVYYMKALKNKLILPALVKLVKAMAIKKAGTAVLSKKLADIRKGFEKEFDAVIYDILIQEKFYNLALSFIKKAEIEKGSNNRLVYYKGICSIFQKKYSRACSLMSLLISDPEYSVRAICSIALCKTLQGKYVEASESLLGENTPLGNATVKVYLQFNKLMQSGQKDILSEDEKESAAYTSIIFDLLKILLRIHEFETFEKALNLLNCITDKTVLLKLAKLYYSDGFYPLAYQEFLRSIKEFDLIDVEGAHMLYKLKLKGIT